MALLARTVTVLVALSLGRLGDRLPAHAAQRPADGAALLCLPGRRAALCHAERGAERTMTAMPSPFARSGEEMTPPPTLAARAKRVVLRKGRRPAAPARLPARRR